MKLLKLIIRLIFFIPVLLCLPFMWIMAFALNDLDDANACIKEITFNFINGL